MPIYAYRCDDCGFEKDVLQKLSDAPLETCPSCGKPAFHKKVSAPAFQLKGTGWYVTDFRDGKGKAGAAKEAAAPGASSSDAPAPAGDSSAGSSGATSGGAASDGGAGGGTGGPGKTSGGGQQAA